MYLKRIEISGFKSFATKTILDFLPSCDLSKDGKYCGVTAIVGPNGSGKSNVADAIKWAMGEQSLKSLRGKKSEDVIFAGSGKKSQLGSAKVSLFFDNTDKKMPLEFEEVAITRKIYRSGEGEYFINGSRVRLIDIFDLLAKAGVGQRSYCIINQGMADAVLTATPLERRVIIEEAAGVKPFQLTRERSLRKLESTKTNLARAGDLVREIEPHLKVLKRQSEKAKKGEEVARELRAKQEELYAYLWQRIRSEKSKIQAEREEAGREEMKFQRKIDDLEMKIREESKANVDFETKRNRLEAERQEIFGKINQAQKDLTIIEAKIEIEKERAKNFVLVNEIPVDFPYVKEKIGEINARFREISEKLGKCEKTEELAALKKEFSELGGEIALLHKEVAQGKKTQESERKRENTVDLRIVGELERRRNEFSVLLRALNGEEETSKKRMTDLIEEDRRARKNYFDLESELRKIQADLSVMRERTNEIRVRMAKIEVREEDLGAKIKDELKTHDPDELLSKRSADAGEPIEVEKYEREIGRLKTLFEQIGAIDPLIIEEYEETQKRFDFLTSQSSDLQKAMASLEEVIKEMNEKIKEAFEEAYERINAEFSKYFKIIFGGGSAELVKVKIEARRSAKAEIGANGIEDGEDADDAPDEETALEEDRAKEVGIEIKACPPGKRISALSMLSGGERALTSQALLFAIISNSPPPFTILDEVEAALDEANSKRFSRILQELSHETQFILITHNRETMRQASVLYGVTMGADGVSKVLSVKLDQVGEKGEIR